MVLSMKWLSDFVDCNDIDIKKYCDRMTDTGSKVEGYELCGSEVDGVRVGHILSVCLKIISQLINVVDAVLYKLIALANVTIRGAVIISLKGVRVSHKTLCI